MNHYHSNLELFKPFEGYLYRQSDPRIARLRYGGFKKEIHSVGCGLVAIYNVMRRIGKPQSFVKVINDAERLRLPWLFGAFGTKTGQLKRYFDLHGVPCKRYKSSEAFKAALNSCDCAIVCTWNDKRRHGIHFYTIFSDNGRLTALNLYNADSAVPFSLDKIKANRFIAGYGFSLS